MKDNKLKAAIAAGRVPVGHMVWEFATRGVAHICATADLDFVLIDMEHSGIDLERVGDLIGWFKATDIAPIVRVPQTQYHFLARVMDLGALGVMCATVESGAQAKEIVDAVKYLPLGRRGVGLGTAHTDYRNPDPVTYFERANANSTVICQIESVAGLENLEAIAGTPGVDILWVGHFDLSNSMGIPGQFGDQRFIDAQKQVVDCARRHGLRAGIQPGTPEQADAWLKLGYDVISYGADTGVYGAALRAGVAGLRGRIAEK